jgi:hypothetical protein
LVSAGALTLAELRNGTLSGGEMDVFQAEWVQAALADAGRVQWAAHLRAREQAPESWAEVDSSFGTVLANHVLRRMLATVRAAQHGGTLIILPHRRVTELLSDGRYMRVKYDFDDEEPRRRILTLMITIMNELARAHPVSDRAVGWDAYEASRLRTLVRWTKRCSRSPTWWPISLALTGRC